MAGSTIREPWWMQGSEYNVAGVLWWTLRFPTFFLLYCTQISINKYTARKETSTTSVVNNIEKVTCDHESLSSSQSFMSGIILSTTWGQVLSRFPNIQFNYLLSLFTDAAKFTFIVQRATKVSVHTPSYLVLLLKSDFYRETYENRRNKETKFMWGSPKCWKQNLIMLNTIAACLGCFLLVKQCLELSESPSHIR